MKTLFIGIFLIAGILPEISAQSRSIGTQPLGGNPKMLNTPADQTDDSARYNKALRVFDKLVEARGDFRLPVPKLVMLKGRKDGNAAFMNYQLHEVQLEEIAYNAAIEYGDAGLAFLLAHELTHYYEKHGWRSGFAQEYGDLKIGMKLQKLTDKVANETEADYLGGFLTYSAGYGLFDKGPEMIQKIYKAYNWGSGESENYPSMTDRQTLLQRTKEKLENLIDVFEMANLLTAIGRYDEAYQYYQYVALRYQSREIYNNLGVTKLLEAMDEFEEKELVFRFPVQLDLDFSGSKGAGAGSGREAKIRQALLQFDAAISLDPDYAPAYLNKACAYVLLGDYTRARFFAAEEARAAALRNKQYAKTAVDAEVLLGIIEAKNGNKDYARKIFETVVKTDSSALAAINLKILNEEPLPPAPKEKTSLKAETIDGLKMQAIAFPSDNDGCPKADADKEIQLNNDLVFHRNPAPGPHSKVFISLNNLSATEPFTIFHLTKPGHPGKTAKNIALGDTRDAIVSAYGEAPRIIETPLGQIMVYKAIIFILENNKLVRWINYTTRSSC